MCSSSCAVHLLRDVFLVGHVSVVVALDFVRHRAARTVCVVILLVVSPASLGQQRSRSGDLYLPLLHPGLSDGREQAVCIARDASSTSDRYYDTGSRGHSLHLKLLQLYVIVLLLQGQP